MKFKKIVITGVAAGLMAGLAACGGNGGGATGTTGTTVAATKRVTGPITAFGSVYVNGSKYDTSGASVYVEGSSASESDLRVGMTVTVTTTSAGVADSIHFADDVEGIVTTASIDPATQTGTLEVMGQSVSVDANTIFESHVGTITSAAEIVAGNIVEVSGSSSGTGSILATRLEVKAASLGDYLATHSHIEVKGIVANHDETGKTFAIGSLVVNYDGASVEMPAGNWDGLYVEVKSTQDLVAGQLLASKVELEDGGEKGQHEDGDEVDVKGQVSDVTDTSVTVNGQTFILTADTLYEHGVAADLIVDAMVEVEGYADANGDLVAKKIEFDSEQADSATTEIKGLVVTIALTSDNEGTISVNGTSIVVTNSTIMHDESISHLTHFNLSQLAVGDKVEVRYVDNGGTLTATKLERKALAPL